MMKMSQKTQEATRKRSLISILFLIVLAVLFSYSTTLASEKLNLGMIDSNPEKIKKRFAPLLQYLETKGVSTGEIIIASSIDEMIENFNNGSVDFIFDSPYPILKIMEATKARPVLIREKGGTKLYRSVIFVNKKSSVRNFSDLAGKVIAFEESFSTSSFFLPKGLLLSKGLKIRESDQPAPGFISYYFTGDDEITIKHVTEGKAEAGGISNNKIKNYIQLRALGPKSRLVPRHVVLIKEGAKADKLITILEDMKNDPMAQDTLNKIKTPTGFSKFRGNPNLVMKAVASAMYM